MRIGGVGELWAHKGTRRIGPDCAVCDAPTCGPPRFRHDVGRGGVRVRANPPENARRPRLQPADRVVTETGAFTPLAGSDLPVDPVAHGDHSILVERWDVKS